MRSANVFEVARRWLAIGLLLLGCAGTLGAQRVRFDKLKHLEALQELVQLPLTIEVARDGVIVRPAPTAQLAD